MSCGFTGMIKTYKDKGVSPQQTVTGFKNADDALTRDILRDSWNNVAVKDTQGSFGRRIGPFRASQNLGDFLNRKNYKCGTRHGACDDTGIAAASGNVKFVPDSSDYTRYRREAATLKNYDDHAL
jgi:hypothetical protein